MSITTAKAVVARFLRSDKPQVLALKGAWGVGKTYAWNQLVLECKDEIRLPSYCYVSLFGVSSIAELRTAIFAKSQPVKRLGTTLDAKTINNEWLSIAGEQAKRLYRFGAGLMRELPYGKNITVTLETLAPHFIRDTIICLDDFERLTTNGSLKAEDILGLISELKEEKGCKVALVFNEAKLADNKETYAKYREKVVDIEVLYDPTPEEASEIALPKDLPCRASIKKNCEALGVKNIRVLRKIVDVVGVMSDVAGKLHPQVMEQATHTLVLLAWCYFDRDDDRPTPAFIRKWNRFVWDFGKIEGEEKDPKEEAWNKQLQAYGTTHLDEFDLTLFEVIERGYLEDSGFESAAVKLDEQFRGQELEQSFSHAWRLFHDTFANNEADLVKALQESFKQSVSHISPLNLSGTTMLLRNLGHSELADGLIDYYLDARASEPGILDLNDLPFSGDIRDQGVWQKFEKRKQETHRPVPLLSAVQFVVEHGSWRPEHLEALRAATEDDFYILLKQDHGKDLSRIVGSCLRFEDWEDHRAIGQKVRRALVRIGRESTVNAVRVRRYGVEVE